MKTSPLKEKLVDEMRSKIMTKLEAVKRRIGSVPEGFLGEASAAPYVAVQYESITRPTTASGASPSAAQAAIRATSR